MPNTHFDKNLSRITQAQYTFAIKQGSNRLLSPQQRILFHVKQCYPHYQQEWPLPQVCDYEGSKYRTDFWEGQNREYEDRV